MVVICIPHGYGRGELTTNRPRPFYEEVKVFVGRSGEAQAQIVAGQQLFCSVQEIKREAADL